MHVTWGAFRRTGLGAVAVLTALLVTFSMTSTTGGAAESAPVESGIGSALAQTALVGPSFANLSLAFAFGRSIAGHTNSVAQASSQAIDLGQVGSSLAATGCDGGAPTLPSDQQPHELRVDSRDAVTSKDEDETFLGGLPMHKHVEASTAPVGKAVTTTAPFGVAGVLEIGGGVATSTSGLVNGVREARAVTDISGIKLVGTLGLIELSSLHWEAVWSSANPSGGVGTFSVGSAKIAGTPIPTNDPNALLAALNTALSAVGIRVTQPTAYQAGGVLFVDPMGIAVVPNATRDAVAALVLQNVQDLRRQVTEALIAQDCGNATYIPLADLVVGSLTGAGEFKIELGGVKASSGKTPESGYTFGGPQLITTGGLEPSVDAAIDTFIPDVGPVLTPPAPARTSRRLAAPAATTKADGTRGGVMAVVGLLGLALLGLLAEGDRRKMRKAQREIPVT
jgi:hypothetical protein